MVKRQKTEILHFAFSFAGAALVSLCHVSANADISSGTRGAGSFNVGMVANPAKAPVCVDACLDDWDLAGQIYTGPVGRSGSDESSVKTAAMWDRENLYLSFVWRDRTPLHSKIDPLVRPQKGWVDDAVQLRVKLGPQPAWVTLWCCDRSVQAFDIDRYEMRKDAKDRRQTFASAPGESRLANGVEMMSVVSEDGKGAVMEAKIPWSVLSSGEVAEMKSGETFTMAFEFMFGNDAGDWPLFRFADNYSGWNVQKSFFFRSPGSWGEIALAAESTKNTRSYSPDDPEPYGVVQVRAAIPRGRENFTLVLEDRATGRRVRTVTGGHPIADAKVGEDGEKDVVEVLWDGLDDAGRPVAPGTYRVHGIVADQVTLRYLSSFYNPGDPPWETADGKGGWGADHSCTEFMATAGTNVVFGSKTPEGGYGIWAVGPSGRKVWSEKRGARALAANTRHVYVLGGYYNEDEQLLFRLDSSTGAYVPFRDGAGKNLPCPCPLSAIPRIPSQARVANIAVSPDGKKLALALEDGRTALLDADSLAYRGLLPTAVRSFRPFGDDAREVLFGTLQCIVRTPFAFDGRIICYFQRQGSQLVAFNIADKTVRAIVPDRPFGEPVALAFSGDGKALYVADAGADMQVRKIALDGRTLATFGRLGGRSRQGVWLRDGMIDMSSVAEDSNGNVWVCERTEFPRRISVWSGADGSFIRDYIGNTHYCGSGVTPHDTNPTRLYAGGTEFRVDLATGAAEPVRTMWNPSPKDPRPSFRIPPGLHGVGPMFRSAASGRERDYMFIGECGRDCSFFLLMLDGDLWRPVAGVARSGHLLAGAGEPRGRFLAAQAPTGEWLGVNAEDTVFWSDADGNGFVSRSECEIMPSAEGEMPLSLGWGSRPDGCTLEIYANTARRSGKWVRYRPVRFLPDGAPVYAPKGVEEMGDSSGVEMPDIMPVPQTDGIVRFALMDGKSFIVATDRDGSFRWRYPDWWHGVHGSHSPAEGNPNGLVFGSIMLLGAAETGGECGGVIAVRANHLHDYYLTFDGLYIGKVFRSPTRGRLLPPSVEEARSIPFEELVGHGEPFMGWFGRHDDGKIRSIHGNFSLACHVCEVGGIDSVVRFESDDLVFTPADVAKAEEFNRALDAKRGKTLPPYEFGKREKVQGAGASLSIMLGKGTESLSVDASVAGDSSPWKNSGNDFTRLFKTGDCIDVQIGDGDDGDQRLVFADFGGRAVCVQMKPSDGGKGAESVVYESPIASVAFDRVRILPVDVTAELSKDGNGWSVKAKVPWSLLGLDPAKPLKGDFGMILSDPAGLHNAVRAYRANKHTGLVSDLPNEARLMQTGWTEFR